MDVVVLKVDDIGARIDSLTEHLKGHEKDLYCNRIDECDEVVKEKAKRVLAKINSQEKTIRELQDQNSQLKMVISVLENSTEVWKRRLERLEASCNRIEKERKRKQKTMKRFKITNGRFVPV